MVSAWASMHPCPAMTISKFHSYRRFKNSAGMGSGGRGLQLAAGRRQVPPGFTVGGEEDGR